MVDKAGKIIKDFLPPCQPLPEPVIEIRVPEKDDKGKSHTKLDDKMKDLWHKYTSDKDKGMTFTEFIRAHMVDFKNKPMSEFKFMWEIMDTDNSDTISFDEFMRGKGPPRSQMEKPKWFWETFTQDKDRGMTFEEFFHS